MSDAEETRSGQGRSPGEWPEQLGASWPPRCLIENVGVHPSRPWLAAACTNSQDDEGAVLVLDAAAGRVRSVTLCEGQAGWGGQQNLVRWHPDGRRLAVNVDMNGIALLQQARIVGCAYPDETRDSGVDHAWVGDQLFADTGALFEIKDGDRRFDFEPLASPQFCGLEWNAAIGAVVGRVDHGIAAFDPLDERLIYHEDMTGFPPWSRMVWSSGGRWCVRVHSNGAASHEIMIFDGDDGRLRGSLRPSRPQTRDVHVHRDGSLLVESGASAYLLTHLDIVRGGRIETTIDLSPRSILRSPRTSEGSSAVWSPSGDRVAVLLDGQEVQIHDARSGARLARFRAPAPPFPAGLPDHRTPADRAEGEPGKLLWLTPDCLVRLGPHFVAFWSTDGQKRAQLVVPGA